MKSLIFIVLPIALTGCLKVEPSTAERTPERIYTVDEFLAQPELRERVSAVCNNDPGQLGQTPNCSNSRRADRIASAGSLANMPRAVP